MPQLCPTLRRKPSPITDHLPFTDHRSPALPPITDHRSPITSPSTDHLFVRVKVSQGLRDVRDGSKPARRGFVTLDAPPRHSTKSRSNFTQATQPKITQPAIQPSKPPPITDHRSPLTDHRSPITDHRSPITDHRPPITAYRSPITSQLHPSNRPP